MLFVRLAHRRSAFAAATFAALVVLSLGTSSRRADAAPEDCFAPTTTSTTTTTPAAPVTGTVTGVYRVDSAITGPSVRSSATITLIGAGPDGLLGTADDTTTTSATAADGSYAFTGVPIGPSRVVADAPPSEEYSIEWFGNADRIIVSGSWGAGNPLALGATVHFVGVDGASAPIDVTQAVTQGQTIAVEVFGSYLNGSGTFLATAPGSTAHTGSFNADFGCSGSLAVSAWVLSAASQDVVVTEAATAIADVLATSSAAPALLACS
jgi:hypothetical protein